MQRIIALLLTLLLLPAAALGEAGEGDEEILLSSFEEDGILFVETEEEVTEDIP